MQCDSQISVCGSPCHGECVGHTSLDMRCSRPAGRSVVPPSSRPTKDRHLVAKSSRSVSEACVGWAHGDCAPASRASP